MQFERRTEASAQARLLRPDTCEAPNKVEQSTAEVGGGKRADQGEHFANHYALDTGRGRRVPGIAGRASNSKRKEGVRFTACSTI